MSPNIAGLARFPAFASITMEHARGKSKRLGTGNLARSETDQRTITNRGSKKIAKKTRIERKKNHERKEEKW